MHIILLKRFLNSCSDNWKSDACPEPPQSIQNLKSLGIVALGVAFAMCGAVSEAQPRKLPRVGILFIGDRDQPHLESFKQGLRERGYVEAFPEPSPMGGLSLGG
jgi:hypothetical protein